MKLNIFTYFLILIILCCSAFAVFDMEESENSQTHYIIDSDTIEIQRDQTELEKQSLIKETEFRVKRETRVALGNELWLIWSTTIKLMADIVVGFFLFVILKIFRFMLIDGIPLLIKKMINNISNFFGE